MLLENKTDRNQSKAVSSMVFEEPVNLLKIAVCDDDKEQLQIHRQVFDAITIPVPLYVEYFTSAQKLTDKLITLQKQGETLPDIIFSDIEMPDMDGIAFGKRLREISNNIYLLLCTAYPEYAIRGYETRAYRYLLKPLSVADVEQALSNILREMGSRKKLLVHAVESESVIALSDIMYLSAEDKYTVLYTKDEHYFERTSLNDYEQLMEQYGFCRVHRKYIVNLTQHQNMEKGKLTLLDGTKLPISRRREAAYRDKLLQILGEELL